jgi:uncharacterized protein YkwD
MDHWKQSHLLAHNKIRQEHNLPLFSISPELENLAHIHVQKMSHQQKLYHLVEGSYYQNIAQGKKNFFNKPELAVNLWMTDNHKIPILNPNLKYLGSSFIMDSNNNVFISCNYQ